MADRPDLSSPSDFQHWLSTRRKTYSDQNILEHLLEDPSDIAALRCASLSFWSPSLERGSFLRFNPQCLNSEQKAIEVYAKSFISLKRLVEAYSQGETTEHLCAQSLIPLLEKALEDLHRAPRTALAVKPRVQCVWSYLKL
jgi:hypothetical protein